MDIEGAETNVSNGFMSIGGTGANMSNGFMDMTICDIKIPEMAKRSSSSVNSVVMSSGKYGSPMVITVNPSIENPSQISDKLSNMLKKYKTYIINQSIKYNRFPNKKDIVKTLTTKTDLGFKLRIGFVNKLYQDIGTALNKKRR